MKKNERVNFGGMLTAILASAGSAVGLGNVWRFPYETGNHGGAAFIFIYILFIVILGLPIMLSEFIIGRKTHANLAGAYRQLAKDSKWRFVGHIGVFTGFLILSYYAVVAGWTLEYIVEAGMNQFAGKETADYIGAFKLFSEDPIRPLIWLALFLFLTHFVIVKGVKSGIERSSKVLMPLLFVLIIVLIGCSLSLPGSAEGVKFLFQPDFSVVDSSVLLAAMGQAFFSLSLGMGCLCTYASYFRNDTNLAKAAVSVAFIDTLIAIMAGLIIFPAAFSVGIQPDSGPSLLFITLPNVFQQAFSGMPILSYSFSILFYLLMAIAALTSTISLHEVVTAYLHEEFHLERRVAARWMTGACLFVGVFASLSLGVAKEYTLFGLSFFELLDFFTAKLMLPLLGFLVALFTGWYLDKAIMWREISNNGTLKVRFFRLYIFILKFIAPIAILCIFLNELHLFG
ncbi:MAG: sodium-dependent transporter [Bacteroidaceae bacterium]